MLAGLVRQARRALMAHSFDALIATGGDTMAALLDAQGIHAFTLLSELEPGFPLGVTGLAGRDRSLLLAMKAGGFGGPDTARRRLAPARSITVPFLLEPSMSASALPMAVTMGDPSGIGPEIVAKTLLQPDYARRCVVVGDAAVMARALDSLGAADRLRVVRDVGEAVSAAAFEPDAIRLLPSSEMAAPPPLGRVDPASGKAAYQAICHAIDLARDGRVAGMVTAPIHRRRCPPPACPIPGTPRSWPTAAAPGAWP